MKKHKFWSVVLSLIIICCCMLFAGCNESPSKYTLEQHTERISERIDERFIGQSSELLDYSLYPLYGENDELLYFLVEFEPYGFVFISLNKVSGIFNREMYRCDDSLLTKKWQRYRLCIGGKEPSSFEGINWLPKENDTFVNRRYEPNEDGSCKEYSHSPYSIAKVAESKKYFLNVYYGYVPAIKQGDNYINLISMEEFEYRGDVQFYKNKGREYIMDNIPLLEVSFFAGLGGEL